MRSLQSEPLRQRLFWPAVMMAIVACSVAFLAYVCLGTFTRYVADDYCYASIAKSKGLLGAFSHWYMGWQGRFSVIILQSAAAIIGPEMAYLLPPVMMVLWLGAMMWTTLQFSLVIRLSRPVLISFLSALLILFGVIDGIPNVFQSLYWQSGLFVYEVPLVLLTIYLGLIGYRLRRSEGQPSVLFLVLSACLAFVAGGTSEILLGLQVSGLLLAALVVWKSAPDSVRRALLPVLTVGLVGSVLAGAIVVLAPGNAVRQSRFPAPADWFIRVRAVAWPMANAIADVSVRKPFNTILLIVLFAWIAFRLHPEREEPTSHPWIMRRRALRLMALSLEIGFASLLLCFLPGGILSIELPERAFVTSQCVLIVTIVCLGYLAGLAFRFTRRLRAWPESPYAPVLALIVVAILLLLGPIASARHTLAEVPTYRAYAFAWDKRDEEIRAAALAGTKTLEVSPPENPWHLKSDVCIAEYYGLDSIVAR